MGLELVLPSGINLLVLFVRPLKAMTTPGEPILETWNTNIRKTLSTIVARLCSFCCPQPAAAAHRTRARAGEGTALFALYKDKHSDPLASAYLAVRSKVIVSGKQKKKELVPNSAVLSVLAADDPEAVVCQTHRMSFLYASADIDRRQCPTCEQKVPALALRFRIVTLLDRFEMNDEICNMTEGTLVLQDVIRPMLDITLYENEES